MTSHDLRSALPALVVAAGLIPLAALQAQAQEDGRDAPTMQPCEAGRISEIEIRRASVFDLEEVDPESGSYRVYAFANRLHIMTRESVIRRELLLEEGDCFDEFLLQESVRALRSLEFLNQATANVESLPDGSLKMVVRTQDDWTLEVSLGISIDEKFTIEGLGVVERNLLGTGTTFGFVRREDLEFLEKGLVAAVPRIPATPLDASGELGWTRTGWYADQMVRLPFRVETHRLAVRERANFRDDVFRFTATPSEPYRYALLPFDLKDGDLAVQGRIGKPGRYWLLGGGVGWEDWVFPGYPESVLEVEGRDFDAGLPAGPETTARLLGQTEAQSALRFNVSVGYRGIHYSQRRGLDAVDAEQDVPVGLEVLLTGGRSLGEFGRNPITDAKSRAYAYYGGEWGRFVLGSELDVEARSVDLAGGGREWRDVLSEFDAQLYTVINDRHTVVARASSSRGTRMSRPFQLALGGRDGVRGYSRDAFPGAESVVFSVEERWLWDWLDMEAADFSMTVFGDAGRMLAGDAPFGVDSGWKASVGIGLRLGVPSGSPKGRRIEFSYPLTGDREQAVYFRYYEDVTGLLLGFADALMSRSRWGGFRPDLSR